jgi:hypothetical protein
MIMLDHICLSDISEENWRAAIDALAGAGWSLRKGGGLDFSWAVLDLDGMRIDMDYDIWRDGEMVFAKSHASTISADLPTELVFELTMA